MAIEIDQSGRVEDLSTGTAVAYSNGTSGALFISAGEKRRLIQFLRRFSLIPAKDLPAVIFSILTFLLIEKKEINVVKVDEEYTGKNLIIEETIHKLFIRRKIKKQIEIRFARIGKQSAAHTLAWRTHKLKGRIAEAKRILEEEILRLI